MSARMEGNKIVIPIEVQLQAQQVIKEMKREIDEMDSKVQKFQSSGLGAATGVAPEGARGQQFLAGQGILQVGAEGNFEQIIEDEINTTIRDLIDSESTAGRMFDIRQMLQAGGMNPASVDSWFSMVKNPIGFFQVFFLRVLPILGGILTAKEIVQFIFDELTARGRIFDLTFRRVINEEFIKLRARELRQQVRVGERQVIFVSEAGSTHPLEVVNTLELVRNRDIFELDVFRVRKGYQF